MATGIFFSDEFIPVLEQELFREPGEDTVFDQFVVELDSFTSKPGDTVRVNGPTFLTKLTDPYNDRMLASISDKVSDNAAQHPDMNKQEIQIQEHLLPNALIVQEFEAAHTVHDLAQINGAVLARDYHLWRDEYIKARMLDSGFLTYVNDRANEAALVEATDLISMTELVKMQARLANRYIPRFSDGNYIAIVDDATIATLMVETKFLEACTRALGAGTPLFRGELVNFAGVRFIRTNNMDTTTGDSDGTPFVASQVLMFGAGTYGMWPSGTADGLVNQARMEFFRGNGGPVVEVRGMPVEVRLREVNDYGRFQEMIWITHNMWKVLDPGVTVYDGTKTVGTDTRFIQKLVGSTILS
jgi:N4-gp56 family major capsid protein